MRKIFNEYGGWAVIIFIIVVLLLLVGSIKSIDDNGKVKGSGLIATIGNIFSDSIEKNNNHLRYLNGECGPNGESLVSTTESQVGKYADVDGDGVVDGIIFADLLFGSNGTWNESDTNNKTYNERGAYTIPTIKGCKNYYISKHSYTNALGGTSYVISACNTGGNNRFYVMALGNMNNSQYFCWYAAAYNTKISNFSNVTSSEFGKGKCNTEIMMKIWENKTYGDLNTNNSFKDLWGFTKKYYNQNWFIPSSKEIAAFADQLKITKNNYLEKNLPYWFWSSSISTEINANYGFFGEGRINNLHFDGWGPARLATTF